MRRVDLVVCLLVSICLLSIFRQPNGVRAFYIVRDLGKKEEEDNITK